MGEIHVLRKIEGTKGLNFLVISDENDRLFGDVVEDNGDMDTLQVNTYGLNENEEYDKLEELHRIDIRDNGDKTHWQHLEEELILRGYKETMYVSESAADWIDMLDEIY